jgi:macrolide-specific efflux system membrane fusion protein
VIRVLGIVILMAGTPTSAADTLVIQRAQVRLLADVRVPARAPGVLKALNVREGDLLSRNQIVGRLETDLLESRRKAADLEARIAEIQRDNDVDLRFARKSLDVARKEHQRAQQANAGFAGTISASELERLGLLVDQAALASEQAQRDLEVADITAVLKNEQLATASILLRQRTLQSPIEGMVVEVFAEPGEWLGEGDPVIRVVGLSRLRVEGLIDGSHFGSELTGQPATFRVPVPGQASPGDFAGEVVFVSPEVQPVTGQVRVWVEVANPDFLLRPGTVGTLTIQRPE